MFSRGTRKKSFVAGDGNTYLGSQIYGSTFAFYKGLSYENTYPSITKIANEFMTIRPYAIDDNGKPVQNVKLIDKLYHPNQQMSSVDFREALAVMTLVHRKAYLLVWRDENGAAVPGGPITDSNIAGFTFLEGVSEIVVGSNKTYQVGGKTYTTDDVIEIFAGVDPYNLSRGYSPSIAASKWANLDDYIAAYQAGLFENGAVPAGQFIITAPTVEAFDEIVDGMQAKHRGSGRNNNVVYTHRPIEQSTGAPANAQIEWIPYAQSNKDLKLSEIFDQANKKIDSAYGVPASIRGVNDNNTYASVRVDEQIFIKYAVLPFATKIWARFTHEMNRITGGLGYAITFDLDIPGVADEEKVEAERKLTEVAIINSLTSRGYSLDSVVDALGLSNAYKLLEKGNQPPEIVNDKPDVDTGGEVEGAPDQNASKSVHVHSPGCGCEVTKQTGTEVLTEQEQMVADTIREVMQAQIDRVIEEKTKNAEDADENEINLWVTAMAVILIALAQEAGEDERLVGISVLAAAGADTANIPAYTVSQAMRSSYMQSLTDVARDYAAETADSIRQVLAQADIEGWNKSELADKLRGIMQTDEWRVQRMAVTETHRSASMGSLDAMKQIQEHTGRKFVKKWNNTPGNVCPACLAMNGKTIPLEKNFLDVGGTIDLPDGSIFENTWRPVEAANLHPNCKCYLTYELVD